MSTTTPGQSLAVPGVLRRLNERKIMEALIRLGPSSRAALTRHTHISPPTVSKTVTALVTAGLVEELEQHGNRTGRPARLYALASNHSQILGLAIDGESCWICVSGVDLTTRTRPSTHLATPTTYAELIDLATEQLRPLLHGGARTLGLGVSVAAVLNPTDGRIRECPRLRFLEERTPAIDLGARLGLPTSLGRLVDGLCLAETQRPLDGGTATVHALLDLTDDPVVALCTGGQLVSPGSGGRLGRIPLTPAGSDHQHLLACVGDPAFARRLDPQAADDAAAMNRAVARLESSDHFTAADLEPLLDDLGAVATAVAHLFAPDVLSLRSRLLGAHPAALERVHRRVQAELDGPAAPTMALRRVHADPAQASLAGFVHHLASALGPSVR